MVAHVYWCSSLTSEAYSWSLTFVSVLASQVRTAHGHSLVNLLRFSLPAYPYIMLSNRLTLKHKSIYIYRRIYVLFMLKSSMYTNIDNHTFVPSHRHII